MHAPSFAQSQHDLQSALQSTAPPLLELLDPPGSTVVTFVASPVLLLPLTPPLLVPPGSPDVSLPPLLVTPPVGTSPLLPVPLVPGAVTLVPGVVPGVVPVLSSSPPPPHAESATSTARRGTAVLRMPHGIIARAPRAPPHRAPLAISSTQPPDRPRPS